MTIPDILFYGLHLPAMLGWGLLLFAPKAVPTTRWVHSGLLPLMLCAFYVGLLFYGVVLGLANAGAGMISLAAVAALFSHPIGLLTGWAQFLTFDLFIGAWIARDGRALKLSHISTLPALVFTLVFGPLGLMLHLLRRGLGGHGWAL